MLSKFCITFLKSRLSCYYWHVNGINFLDDYEVDGYVLRAVLRIYGCDYKGIALLSQTVIIHYAGDASKGDAVWAINSLEPGAALA